MTGTFYNLIDNDGQIVAQVRDIKTLVDIIGYANSWDDDIVQYYVESERQYSIPIKNFVSSRLLEAIDYSKVKP